MKCFINKKETDIRYAPVMTPPYDKMTDCGYVISSFSGGAEVELWYDEPISSAAVRPISLNADVTYAENRVFIRLEKACNISVEVNGSVSDAVLLFFTEQKCENTEGFCNIIRFENGEYDIDELLINEDNTAVYIGENAFVNGRISANGVNNLKIFGTGVISMKNYFRGIPDKMTRCVDIQNCTNADISDICIIDSCNWSLRLNNCENVNINNLKVIGSRGNSDGIDVCGSRNVRVSGCFIRTFDDSFVVKAFGGANVENLIFENSVLWNDMARPIEVGVEIRCDTAKNITFRNIDVIHSLTSYPIFGIHHGDRADVSDIHFQNIRIENAPGAQLFDFRITDSVWNTDSIKGKLHDIYVNDIFITGRENSDFRNLSARIECFDEKSSIKNVHIGRIEAFGKRVCSKELLGLSVKGNVGNVTFKNESECSGIIGTKLEEISPFSISDDGMYRGTVGLSITNNTGKFFEGVSGIKIFPLNKSDKNKHEFTFSANDRKTVLQNFNLELLPGKYVIESFGSSIEFKPDILYLDLEYVLSESIHDAAELYFNNCFGDSDGGIRFSFKNGWLAVKSELLKEYDIALYTANVPETENNQIMFADEETYFGEAPAVKWEMGKFAAAPEIGNHWEITYVFKNQPKVREIKKTVLPKNAGGFIKVPLEALGLSAGDESFLLEAELKKNNGHSMPYTLFRSTIPGHTAHMFCKFSKK